MFDFNTERRQQLFKIIKQRSFSSGGSFELASGAKSTRYFEMKATMLEPQGAHLVAHAVGEIVVKLQADYVGGLAMGAVPIASVVAAMSFAVGSPMRAFFVRKQTKQHGARMQIEGLHINESLKGKRVVVVEDVTTTGASALRAVDIVEEQGGLVVGVVTLVDRQEGAQQSMKDRSIDLYPIFLAEEFAVA